MSSLIFFCSDDQAVVATDTLACDLDGVPAIYVDKAFMVPHLRMIIAGTGAGSFADRWFLKVSTGMAVRDVAGLNVFTPDHLREMWAAYVTEFRPPESLTTTVYQFGFEADEGPLRAFAYRSTNGFASELLPDGVIGAKPDCTLPGDSGDVIWPDHFRTMMDEQRQLQSVKPLIDRVHIGGEIQVFVLERDSMRVFSQSKFDDYQANLEAILQRHSR